MDDVIYQISNPTGKSNNFYRNLSRAENPAMFPAMRNIFLEQFIETRGPAGRSHIQSAFIRARSLSSDFATAVTDTVPALRHQFPSLFGVRLLADTVRQPCQVLLVELKRGRTVGTNDHLPDGMPRRLPVGLGLPI
jgi:hypothetical protein